MLFTDDFYYGVLWAMVALAVVVFIALRRIEAPYGMTFSRRWGPSVGNKTGWVLMELPAFVLVGLIWALSPRREEMAPVVIASFFMLHYFHRTFIFPLLMRGKSQMALIIMVCGMLFNSVNAYLIGGWLFYLSPEDMYDMKWLCTPQFIAGTIIFFAGMAINLHSDYIVRNLRQPGDTRHYIPMRGLYRYVTAANYFGEFSEWIGFAVLTWSLPGVVFALWTFANLAPRARTLHSRYVEEFGDSFTSLHRRYIIPYIY